MITLRAGSRVGRFHIVRILGRGSSGAVYLATDPQIERPIALKVFWPEEAPVEFEREEAERQYLKEARLAGRLQHPHIVTVYDIGREGDGFFIAMEYVEGEALKQALRAGEALPVAMAVSVVRQVAEALGHAHEKGVLHRDIKPGNILLCPDGRVKVTDFGVGELLTAATYDDGSGLLLGSPPYMSPEQIRDERLDSRSDLFSLGVVFYELLTGARPFGGDSLTKVAYKILNTEPEDPRVARPELPAAATELFRRLLAKERQERPADAREFLQEIERFAGAAPEAVPVAPAFTPVPLAATRPPGSRRRSVLAIGAGAALVAALVLFAASRVGRSPVPRIAPAQALRLPLVREPTAARSTLPGEASPLATAVSPAAPSPMPPSAVVPRSKTPVASRGKVEMPVIPASIGDIPDRTYRTRRFARFAIRPEQSRLFVDGQYIGIADDWDGWAGAGVFPFRAEGIHRVRVELPGHRSLKLVFLVTPDAKDKTVEVKDRLERVTQAAYARVPSLGEKTTGAVELTSDPPAATVSAGTMVLGPASSFGANNPLRLSGPAVHELTFSAPSRTPKTVRVLVSSNAGRDVAHVKVRLDRVRVP